LLLEGAIRAPAEVRKIKIAWADSADSKEELAA